MEPLPLPSSFEEVEALIRALYEPNPPETISRIQEVLQRLQKSPEGWHLAQHLMASPEDNVKFFAALTIIVKLNRDSENLTEKDAADLLENLVGWFLQALETSSGALVVKKLCTALVTYFVHFSASWPNCVRHLAYCLQSGRFVPLEVLNDAGAPRTDALVGDLSVAKLRAAVWFVESLAEEVGKTDMNSVKYNHVHKRLAQNTPDATLILARGVSPSLEIRIREDALACFQAWILYAQRASMGTGDIIEPLRTLVEPAMLCFGDNSLFGATCELFTDVLSNYPAFFTASQYDSLAELFETAWAQEHYRCLRETDHGGEGPAFGLFLLAYGDAKLQDLMESTDDRRQQLLGKLGGLLSGEGYPVGEDLIFVPAVEFWSTFVETLVDATASSHEEEAAAWAPVARNHVRAVVLACWRKIQWPTVETFATWDSDDRVGFSDARKDVADLLQFIFNLDGHELVSTFVSFFFQFLPTQAWAPVEAALFCLASISDCFSDNSAFDDELVKVFSDPFFELLGQVRTPIPLRLRQTGLSLIERYSEYFERHAEYLPHALNLLFGAVGDPALGGSSARSISILCSSCRSILTGEVSTFMSQYQAVRNTQAIDTLAEEKIVLAIASIIQAIPEQDRKWDAFEQLYIFAKDECGRALMLNAQPNSLDLSNLAFLRGIDQTNRPATVPTADAVAMQLALRGLRCLGSMAKGMQDMKEQPIDLESEPHAAARDGRLAAMQEDIMHLLADTQRAFSRSSEVVETVCSVLRAGFSETEPGPFVFPPDVIVEFFVTAPVENSRPGTLLSMACSFVGSLIRSPQDHVPEYLDRLLHWDISLLQMLPAPESDPEVTQHGIDFVDRVMTRYPEVVFNIQPTSLLEFFFYFSLSVLDGKEPLPKNAAADFWTNFITLRPSGPETQATAARAMEALGPVLARSLVSNVGGRASRSELDRLSEPLKKLVAQQVHAQAWLEDALLDEASFPSELVSRDEKMLFLRKVIGLRGARATNQVVREFWLACRGSNFAYAS